MRLTLALLTYLALGIATCCAGRVEMHNGTSAASFKKQLYDEIGAVWKRSVQKQMDMLTIGTIRVAFAVSPEGKITRMRVLQNTSRNEDFERICRDAI